MKLATETITVFHYSYNPETGYDDWTPTVIQGVSLHGNQRHRYGTCVGVTDNRRGRMKHWKIIGK